MDVTMDLYIPHIQYYIFMHTNTIEIPLIEWLISTKHVYICCKTFYNNDVDCYGDD